MTYAKELELAEQELDRLLMESNREDPPSQLVLLAYEAELVAHNGNNALGIVGSSTSPAADGESPPVADTAGVGVAPWRWPRSDHGRIPGGGPMGPRRNQHTGQCYCKHGHELTPENTYRHSNGWRECRTCKAAADARHALVRRDRRRRLAAK